MELIFQELNEIFRLPMKFLDPPLQRVCLKFRTILKKLLKLSAIMYTKHQTITKLKCNTGIYYPLIITFITKPK